MDLRLKGKTALVTGSTAGIGEAIAKALALEGVIVVVNGRNEKEANRVVQEIQQAKGKALLALGDLSTEEAAENVVQKALKEAGKIEILINNAGAFPEKSWVNATSQDWLELYNQNVVSMVRLIRLLLPHMKNNGWGRLIQMASVAGTVPLASMPQYAATKAANINMTVSLSKELKGTLITANTVSPGPILTPGAEKLFRKMGKEKGWGTNWEEIEKHIVEEFIPSIVPRLGRPHEVGALVTFLASPLADFITGSNFRIDGGVAGVIN